MNSSVIGLARHNVSTPAFPTSHEPSYWAQPPTDINKENTQVHGPHHLSILISRSFCMPQCIPDDAILHTHLTLIYKQMSKGHMVFLMQCIRFITKDRDLKFHNIIAYVTQTSSHYSGWIQEGPWEHKRPQHQLLRDATVQECVKDRQVYQWCECHISDCYIWRMTAYSIFKVLLC